MENQAKEFKNPWRPKFANNCKIMKIIIKKKDMKYPLIMSYTLCKECDTICIQM